MMHRTVNTKSCEAVWLLGLRVWITLRAWVFVVLVACCAKTCSEKSYWVCLCLILRDLETSTVRQSRSKLGCCATDKKLPPWSWLCFEDINVNSVCLYGSKWCVVVFTKTCHWTPCPELVEPPLLLKTSACQICFVLTKVCWVLAVLCNHIDVVIKVL